jgi:hypothetical protein
MKLPENTRVTKGEKVWNINFRKEKKTNLGCKPHDKYWGARDFTLYLLKQRSNLIIIMNLPGKMI